MMCVHQTHCSMDGKDRHLNALNLVYNFLGAREIQ
jgi:hypothetical protein